MSIIHERIKFKDGDKAYHGYVLDKYTKAIAWDTGNGMVSGNYDYYMVRVSDEIKHIRADKVIGIVNE